MADALQPSPARYRFDEASRVWFPREARQTFTYTDGEALERRLLEFVLGCPDRSVLSMPLRAGIVDWPTRYHLSPLRANLLRPLAERLRGARVLEVGAGCGAITRYLGECAAQVLAIEGSPQRAAIAAARCADQPNVSVVADALDRLPVEPAFDVVTLIGVLEYARVFFPAPPGVDPVDAMLAHVRRFLRPDGALIVAIENRLGLKYFAGAAEDHVGAPMYGIEDRYRPDGVVTFGRAELDERMQAAGFGARQWFYPFPDYKLPVSVLSEAGMSGRQADLAALLSGSVVADPQAPPRFLFSLESAWRSVYRNRLGGELANSFLVLAAVQAQLQPHSQVQSQPQSQSQPQPEPQSHAQTQPHAQCDDARRGGGELSLAWHFSADRRPCFAKALRIVATPAGVQTEPTKLSEALPDDRALSQRLQADGFVEGEPWQSALFRVLNEPGWEPQGLVAWSRRWLDALLERAASRAASLDDRLPGELLDAVPRNLIVDARGRARFIDLEWVMHDGVGFDHLLYRGIALSLLAVGSVAPPARAEHLELLPLLLALTEHLGHPMTRERAARCHDAERDLQRRINGVDWIGFDAVCAYRLPLR